MKRSYQVALVLGLGGLGVGGFSFGYLFHAQQALNRFARESDRTCSDYDIRPIWLKPTDGGKAHLALLASPSEGSRASRDAQGRWKWGDPEATEACTADEHRMIWRFGKDRWEILEDLDSDRSSYPFTEAEDAAE